MNAVTQQSASHIEPMTQRYVQEPRFGEVLKALVTPPQMERIGKALAPIAAHVGH